MNFRAWLESVVKFGNVQEAIKRTLEFVVDNGRWGFESRVHGIFGLRTVTVAGHFYCDKGHFFLTANTLADKPIDSYDSVSGDIDGNSKIEIIGSLSIVLGPGNIKKIAERSRTEGGRLNSPYQLALWVKNVIDNWPPDNDGGDDGTPVPSPIDTQLVGV